MIHLDIYSQEQPYRTAKSPPTRCSFEKGEPKVIIATSMIDSIDPKYDEDIFFNVLTSLESVGSLNALESYIKPVVFTEEGSLWEKMAKERGITVINEVELNRFRKPFLRHMMSIMESRFDALFYGYVENRLLLAGDFVFTLEQIGMRICANEFSPKVGSFPLSEKFWFFLITILFPIPGSSSRQKKGSPF